MHGALHPEGGHVKVTRDPRDSEFKGVCPFHHDCVEGMATNVAIKERCKLADVDDVKSLSDED